MFSSIEDHEVTSIAPPDYTDALNRMKTGGASSPPIRADIHNGELDMHPHLFNTSQVTLAAEVFLGTSNNAVGKTALNIGRQKTTINDSSSASAAAALLDRVIATITALQARFARHAEVDEDILTHFEKTIIPNSPPLRLHEDSFLKTSTAYDDRATAASSWKRSKRTVKETVTYLEKLVYGDSAWGIAVADVDVSAARALAWLFHLSSQERRTEHFAEEGAGALAKSISIPNSHSMLHASLVTLNFGLSDRIFATWFAWAQQKESGGFVLAFGPMQEFPDKSYVDSLEASIEADKRASVALRGELRGFYHITPRARNVCEITLVLQGKLFGKIPVKLLNARVKTTLGFMRTMQRKFERNGRVVDAEIRETLSYLPALNELSFDQKAVLASCSALNRSGNISPRIELTSTDPFVNMWMEYSPPVKGERSVAVGGGAVVVDASAQEAAAWFSDYCGRERTRASKDRNDSARVVVFREAPHDATYAIVKRFPFPLRKREFVFRSVAYRDEIGNSVVASHSVPRDRVVDFGADFKAVRATASSVFKVEPLGPNSCKCVLVQMVDAGGVLPPSVVNKSVPRLLEVVSDLRAEFQRDEEVDAIETDEFARIILEAREEGSGVALSAEEDSIIIRVRDKLAIEKEVFRHLKSPDFLVEMGVHYIPGQSNGVVRASAVLDAPVEECLAKELCVMTRDLTKKHFSSSALHGERSLVRRNRHHAVFRAVYDFKIPGLQPREFVSSQVWKWQDENTAVKVYESMEISDDFPINSKYVRASTKILWTLERLPEIGGVHQTRATWLQQVDLKGAIPKSIVNGSVVGQLMHLSSRRISLDRSLDIDAATRALHVEKILSHTEEYSGEENKTLDDVLQSAVLFEDKGKSRAASTPSPLVKNSVAFKKGNSLRVGRSEAIVKAPKMVALAYLLDMVARCRWGPSDLERTIVETKNDHHLIAYLSKRSTHGAGFEIKPRHGCQAVLWREEADGSFVLVGTPVKHPTVEDKPTDRVLTNMWSSTHIKEISPGVCKIVYTNQLDLGGSVPVWVMNYYVVMNLSLTFKMQNYFQELRTLQEYDKFDGAAIGTRLMHPGGLKNLKRWEQVADIVRKHAGLREMAKTYPWLEDFLREAVRGSLAFASSVDTRLDCLTKAEARKIGGSLSAALRQRKTPEAGLYQWMQQNRGVRELFEAHPWMEELMIAIAKEVLKTAPWGLVWRVLTGALLSLMDMASDLNVVATYYNTPGQAGYGRNLLGMIVACLALQLVIVAVQNWKKKQLLAREILIVLTCFKPAFDAAQVLRGKDQYEHNVFDAKTELAMTKGVEMFAEAIPGTILQFYVVMQLMSSGQRVPKRAVFSILISALTTGFSSATFR
jgi:hypothetical protein